MSEVLEVTSKLILLAGLFCFAWQDYKTGMLSVMPLILFMGGGVGVHLLAGTFSVSSFLMGTLVGLVCLFISMVTAESLGIGDGLLFLGTGMFLGLRWNFALFCGALILAGGFSGICLLLKKKSRKDKIPMAPFVLVAYVLLIL